MTPPPPEPLAALAKAPSDAGHVAHSRVLRVEHETRYDYEDEVEIAHHVGHLRPRSTQWQQVSDWRLEVDPPPGDLAPDQPEDGTGRAPDPSLGVRLSTDCWGNWRVSFSHARVHEHLVVRARFLARMHPRPAPDLAASPPWEALPGQLRYDPATPFEPASEFALATRLAPTHPALAALALEAFRPERTIADGALALMHLVHERFEYRPASTSVNTIATEALALRKGVCQDFAHVTIGAMRSIGLSARYVSGYLLTHPPPGQPRLVGADATHAWVEAWCPVNGWIGLDPTNGVLAGQDHVTVAWGRDYADVAPLRGVIRGGGKVQPRVAVTVEPIADARG